MDEYFLHYLWKFQKFKQKPFRLTNGSTLQVYHPGHSNQNAGPDFLEAKIRIDDIEWAGAVEIHHKASDWIHHNHQSDKKYHGVILHVVWIADRDIQLPDGSLIPTFLMSDYQNGSLEADYRKYINQPVNIKCASFLHRIDPLTITNMLDQALVERLSQKSNRILEQAKSTNGDWEKVTFRVLAENFGFSVNNTAFETWARTIDFSILHRYADQKDKCFALAFGQAGFLDATTDNDVVRLREEYLHLKNKHQLSPIMERHHWKFSRLRPANFPTVRMAEFLSVYLKKQSFFSSLINTTDIKEVNQLFKVELPDYWKSHYDFGLKLDKRTNNLGQASIDILIINTVAPVLAAYSRYIDDQAFMDRAVQFLNSITAEENKITREWSNLGLSIQTAADSQALIQRYKNYCIKKRCLNCNIGIAILHSRP